MTSPGGLLALRTGFNGQVWPKITAAMPRNFKQERYNFQRAKNSGDGKRNFSELGNK